MERKILPFYMTFPENRIEIERSFMPDELYDELTYFRQLCPVLTKFILKEVTKALDIVDYEGSMIYDEYPDKLFLEELAGQITKQMHQAFKAKTVEDDENSQYQLLMKNEQLEDYVMMVMLQEILTRRHRPQKIKMLTKQSLLQNGVEFDTKRN